MRYSEITFNDLIKEIKEYNPNTNINLIKDTFDFAKKIHGSQVLWKKPFATHLLETASILTELKLDDATIIATLLHHAKREGSAKEKELQAFGKEIFNLVEEYTKITDIEDKNRGKISNKLLGEVILATAKDIRAIFIKLAARLEALRFIEFFPEKERKLRAETALNVYVPICHKLGLHRIEWELEDLSFKILNPSVYATVKRKIKEKRRERDEKINEIIKGIDAKLKEKNISATIKGRPKHFYGIYKKMRRKKFEEIHDLLAIRIICDSITECYEALGIIHSNYDSSPEKFQDYIANPKENKYRSIHLVIKWENQPAEVQIRTWDMHADAESGYAAHWMYKRFEKDRYFDKKLSWAKQLVEWQQSRRSKEFIRSMRLDFGEEKIFVFTPKKEVIVLPEKSTSIDFAFAVHSDIGHRVKKAMVNGKITPLNYELQNADAVEIITSPQMQTKQQWLRFVKSDKAVTRIKQKLGIKSLPHKKTKTRRRGEQIKTAKDDLIRIAKCCSPLPGDEMVGYRTTKRKISVHRKDCPNIKELGNEKINVQWTLNEKDYSVNIKVKATDRPMLLRDILDVVASTAATINSTNATVNQNNVVTCLFDIKIKNLQQLKEVIEKIKTVESVHTVERA